MTQAYPSASVRIFITASIMAATVMNALDTTIANVALPHIQGSVSASADEITWVLTSYIIATAIFTPLTGWIAGRFGRKRLMLWSVMGFTIASLLCGIATNLGEIVGFRLLQGVFGAALVPMSQAILLDINPPERHASAMSIWSMGAVLGPIIGPALGGWLTDNLSWHWVFFINLPVGILAFVGLSIFLPETEAKRVPLDMFGFGMLALALGCFQLMLDRGQVQDWFSSVEICLEAAAAAFFGALFLVHTLTARRPFIDLVIFRDRNFAVGTVFAFVLGVILYTVLSLLPPMLENLMGYPVVLTGIVMAPRGIGSFIAMMLAGRLLKYVDGRILLLLGFALCAASMYSMAGSSLDMGQWLVASSGFVQGAGSGLLFVALSTMTFSTLDPRFRNEGAAMFSLVRNIGSAVGISVLQVMTARNGAIVHARLIEGIRPDNPVMAQAAPGFDFTAPMAVASLNAEVTRQATMVAYIDAFWFVFLITLVAMPMLLIMRKPRTRAGDEMTVHMD